MDGDSHGSARPSQSRKRTSPSTTPKLRVAVLLVIMLGVRFSVAAEPAFVFRNTTREAGLVPDVSGIYGHAAGWGDADGDGWIDLYVGTFFKAGSKTNMLFRNRAGKFTLDEQEALRFPALELGLFADLDNDGDLDLYVASMPQKPGKKMIPADELPRGCQLFRNDGRANTRTFRPTTARARSNSADAARRRSITTAMGCSICSSAKIHCRATTVADQELAPVSQSGQVAVQGCLGRGWHPRRHSGTRRVGRGSEQRRLARHFSRGAKRRQCVCS